MNVVPFLRRHQRWLWCFVLGLPAVFLPHYDYMGPSRTRYSLGWPFYGADVLIFMERKGVMNWYFQPDPASLLLLVTAWTFVMNLAVKTRYWSFAQENWLRASVRAMLTSACCILLFISFDDWIGMLWEYHLYLLDWSELERAYQLSHSWMLPLYGFGLIGVLAILYADACRRQFKLLRLPYLACACCIVLLAWQSVPLIRCKLSSLERGISYAQKQPQKIDR